MIQRAAYVRLCGRTFEEAKGSIPLVPADQIIYVRKLMAKRGYIGIEEASPTVIRYFPNVVLDILIP